MNRNNDMRHALSPTRGDALDKLLAGRVIASPISTDRPHIAQLAEAARSSGVEVRVHEAWAGPGATLWTIVSRIDYCPAPGTRDHREDADAPECIDCGGRVR